VSGVTWAEVAAWAAALYPEPAALPEELLQRIEEWRRLPTPAERAGAALRAVQDEVRYFSVALGESSHRPSEPAATWTRRYGDCKDKARLLSTILGQLGIEAVPALVSSEYGRGIATRTSAADWFDHVIVRARIAGETFWLDGTRTQQRGPLEQLDVGDFGVALPVAAGTKELVPIVRAGGVRDAVKVTERLEPDADASGASLAVVTVYEGTAAERMRRDLAINASVEVARRYGRVLPAPVRHDHEHHAARGVRRRDAERADHARALPARGSLDREGARATRRRVLRRQPVAERRAARRDEPRSSRSPSACPRRSSRWRKWCCPRAGTGAGPRSRKRSTTRRSGSAARSESVAGVVRDHHRYEALHDVVETERMSAHLKARRSANDVLGTRNHAQQRGPGQGRARAAPQGPAEGDHERARAARKGAGR
jgi:hypothetical protein